MSSRRAVSSVILAACAALALGGAAGCAPTIGVHHTEVRGPSAEGLNIVVHLTVDNDNPFDIEIRNVRAQVTLEGRWALPTIDAPQKRWLPANKRSRVAVPITIPWGTLPGVLAATASQSEVAYRIRGRADVVASRSMRIDKSNYAIDDEGTIPRSKLSVSAPGGGAVPGGLLPF
jgi:LEA14-like dessication related protein